MLTIVVSGAASSRVQAVALLTQAGCQVEDSDHPHGFERENGESFITAHGTEVDSAVRALEPIGWSLRSHWEDTGNWSKIGNGGSPVAEPDAIAELNKIKAALRAANIKVDD